MSASYVQRSMPLPSTPPPRAVKKAVGTNGHLPFNRDAELSLVGCLLHRPEYIPQVKSRITEDMFIDLDLRQVYNQCLLLHADDKPIDLAVMTYHMHKVPAPSAEDSWEPFLLEIVQSPASTARYEAYADIVLDQHKRRLGMRLINNISDNLKNDTSADAGDLLISTANEMSKVAEQGLSAKTRTFEESAPRMQALARDVAGTLVPTGIKRLDHQCAGMRRKELTILAARPSVGKTSLAMNIGYITAFKEMDVMMVSVEMSNDDMFYRLIGLDSGIPVRDLMKGAVDPDVVESVISDLSKKPVSRHLHFVDDIETLEQLESRCMVEVSRKNISLIVIDYLQLLTSRQGAGNRNLEVAAISRKCKLMAKKLNVAVVLLSQLNRDVERRAEPRPNLSDLRDSGSIEQDADQVWFLYRRGQDDEKIVRWYSAKNRNGPTGPNTEVLMNFEPTTMRLS